MKLENWRQVENTRKKLRLLQEQYEEIQQTGAEDQRLRDLTLRSMKTFMNQLQEEIMVVECHASAQAKDR
jgi:hypothetical protein